MTTLGATGLRDFVIMVASLTIAGARPLKPDAPPADLRATLERLETASAGLRSGRYAEARAHVETLGAAAGPWGEVIDRVATALELEAEGRREAAIARMTNAMDLEIAMPDVLAVMARFFVRVGDHRRARAALAALAIQAPGRLADLMYQLPVDALASYAPWALRTSMSVADPDLYGLLPFKEALAERYGATGAAVVVAGTSAPGSRRRAAELPLRRLIDHAREHGHAYGEAIPAASVMAAWPPVFEEPPRPEYEAQTRTLFTARLEDIVVSGKSNMLLTPQAALHDVQGDELERIPVDLRVDPIIAAVRGDEVVVAAPEDRETLRRIPAAIWLGGVHSGAFGHLVIEFLPKIWALKAHHGQLDMPVIVDRQMPRQHLEALRFFARPTQLVVIEPGEQLLVDQLWVASQLVYMPVGPLAGVIARPGDGVIDAPGLMRLLEPYTEQLDALLDPTAPKRVYFARPPGARRRFGGADEVEAQLDRRGYTTVHPEDLGFEEQIRIVRNADRVVGPDGSALMLTVFGRPGLRVGVFTHPYLEEFEWFTQATKAKGQELSVLTGPITREDPTYRTFSDYDIDAVDAARFLDAFDAELEPAEGDR